MTEDEILSALKPCPFCGAGETEVDAVRLVTIRHWCPRHPSCVDQHIEVRGLDAEAAVAQWNARAGGAE